MSRLPAVSRDKLGAEHRDIWDRVMSGHSAAGGPYSVLMYAPAMAEHLSTLEDYFRHHGMLDTRDKEIAILAAARQLNARFPWTRHEIRAHEAGVRSEAIEALRANQSLDALTARERLIVDIAHSLLRERHLRDDLFSRALAELGPERLVELVGLVGHYNLISTVANVFDLAAPEGSRTF
jgi:4-carboxymuconolactone decarboxylase